MTTKTKSISLIIAGINGRMGRASVQAIRQDTGIELVAAYGSSGASYIGKTVEELVGVSGRTGSDITVKSSLNNCLAALSYTPDVLLDFTKASSAVDHALQAIKNGIKPIIGTSGLTDDH